MQSQPIPPVNLKHPKWVKHLIATIPILGYHKIHCLMHTGVLSAYVCISYACLVLREKRALNPLGLEPSCRCWELNPHALQEQPVLLNAETSL